MIAFVRFTKHPTTRKWMRAEWVKNGHGWRVKFPSIPGVIFVSDPAELQTKNG